MVHLQVLVNNEDLEDLVRRALRERVADMLNKFNLPFDKTTALLRRSGSILSGSSALELAVPGSCAPGDLDFYCPRTRAKVFVGMLVKHHGFLDMTVRGSRRDFYSRLPGIERVYTLRHSTDDTCKINVIESTTQSPFQPVMFFHSTVVMNFMTGDGVALLYPAMTTSGQGT